MRQTPKNRVTFSSSADITKLSNTPYQKQQNVILAQ